MRWVTPMAKPRCVPPGATYFITRRCVQRMLLLRPDPTTCQAFLYALALAAQKTGVLVHAACMMSNHFHLVVTDPLGRVSDFLRELNRTIAKVLNAMHGRSENVWDVQGSKVQRVLDGVALVDRVAYAVANPTSAGLVPKPEQWPGVLLWTPQTLVVRRPTAYFGEKGRCPERITLQVVAPETPWSEGEWRGRLKTAIAARVFAAHCAMARAKRRFAGARAVLSRAITDRPDTYAKRSPQRPFATSLPDLARRAKEDRARFLWEYREALQKWCQGCRDVVFPSGTWWMVRHHGAAVAPPPPHDLAA